MNKLRTAFIYTHCKDICASQYSSQFLVFGIWSSLLHDCHLLGIFFQVWATKKRDLPQWQNWFIIIDTWSWVRFWCWVDLNPLLLRDWENNFNINVESPAQLVVYMCTQVPVHFYLEYLYTTSASSLMRSSVYSDQESPHVSNCAILVITHTLTHQCLGIVWQETLTEEVFSVLSN